MGCAQMSGPIVPGDLVMVIRGEHAGATGSVVDGLRGRRVLLLPGRKVIECETYLVTMARPLMGRTDWAWQRGAIVKLSPGGRLDEVMRETGLPA